MNVPSYQYLKVFDLEDLRRELIKYNPTRHPLVVYIKELDDEEAALELISEILIEKKFKSIPYPLYVISNIKNYIGQLNIFDKIENLPQFFNKKYRQPNSKEIKVLDKTQLLIDRLKFIDLNQATNDLLEYSKQHKNLNLLSREGMFLEKLLFKLNKKI